MASQDPIRRYLDKQAAKEQEPTDPIERFVKAQQARGQTPPEPEGVRPPVAMMALLDAFINPPGGGVMAAPAAQGAAGVLMGGIKNVSAAIASMSGPTPLLPSPGMQVAAAGVLGKGVIEPVAGAIGFPGALLGFRTNKATDFLMRAAQGLYDETEKQAKAAGMTDAEIQITHDIGGFIGMTVPMVSSIKAAQMARASLGAVDAAGGLLSTLKSPASYMAEVSKAVTAVDKIYGVAGPFTTDMVAGAIYGGVFHEGDAEARLKSALNQSAMWGAFRLIITGAVPPFLAWRQRRAWEIDREGELSALIRDLENGIKRSIPKKDMASVLELIQNEDYMLMSPAAQDMLLAKADDLALLTALHDLRAGNSTGVVFRHIGANYEQAAAQVAKYQAKYPMLKFSLPIRRETPHPGLTKEQLKNVLRGTKVAGPDGEPLLVWHGSQRVGERDVARVEGRPLSSEFDPDLVQESNMYAHGFNFSDNPELANRFATAYYPDVVVANPEAPHVYQVTLNIQNPLNIVKPKVGDLVKILELFERDNPDAYRYFEDMLYETRNKTVLATRMIEDYKSGIDVYEQMKQLGGEDGGKIMKRIYKELGWDGIVAPDPTPGGKQFWVAFEPEQIHESWIPSALEKPKVSYDVYFGTKALNSTQLRQLKAEGRFDGQVLQLGAQKVEYVGRGKGDKLKTHVRVRYVNSKGETKVKHVKETSITDTPFVVEKQDRLPAWDAIYQDYFEWMTNKAREISNARGGVPESDYILAAREGKLHLGNDQRRVFDVGGAIVHPEEAGLLGEASVEQINMKYTGPQLFDLNFTPEENIAGLQGSGRIRQDPRSGRWILEGVIKGGDRTIVRELSGRTRFRTLDEALDAAATQDLEIEQVTKKYAGGDEITGLIAQEGLTRATLMQPPTTHTFNDLFDFWAKERGLPLNTRDSDAMREYFASRVRRWAWDQVPAEERATFDALVAEQEKLMGDGDLPLEVLAHQKGFFIQRQPSGRIVGRHMETGLPVYFGGERTAREGLTKIVRPEVDLPSILPMGPAGLQAFTGGFPVQDLLQFPDHVATLETLRDMRWQSRVRQVRNLRDVFVAIERESGIPLYTEGLDPILRGREAFLGDYDPYAKIIQKTWKGINKERRSKIVDFWVWAEDQGLEHKEALAAMRRTGEFSAAEVVAFSRSRAILDKAFEITNISPERYIKTYYGRLRPFYEQNGAMDVRAALGKFADITPSEFQFWAEMTRTGNLTTFEKDPEMMLHKYVRGALWKKHLKDPWDRMAVLVETRGSPAIKIKDLPPEKQMAILSQPGLAPGTTLESKVLPTPLRDVIKEFLINIRGTPGAAEETARQFAHDLLTHVGVKANPQILEEFTSVMMSTWYGSALALRPATQARNMTQVIWNLYTRQGGRFIQAGMAKALTQEGFEEPLTEGVFHITEAGIPYGDAITQNLMDQGVFGEKGIASDALASAIRKGLRAGTITKQTARKMLIPYSSSDQISRGWAYWATKMHVDDWLTKFEQNIGKTTYAKFEEEGLAFFDPVIKRKFRQLYDTEGRESALRFIGRMGSDETNFLYVTGVQPALLQRPMMRPFGMFGTYPLWQLELYFNRMRNGTPSQIAKFAVRNMILIGALSNMSYQTGTDMWAWLAPSSAFGWSGGPAVQYAIDAHRVVTAPLDEKAAALNRFAGHALRLSFPGQGFARDLSRASTVDNPQQAFLSLVLGRPVDDVNWAMDYMYDPTIPVDESFMEPEFREHLMQPWPAPKAGTMLQFGMPESPYPDSTRVSGSQSVRVRTPPAPELLEGTIK